MEASFSPPNLKRIGYPKNTIYMRCQKCLTHLAEYHEHHVLPKYMDNPHGYSLEGIEHPNRISLCFDCHKKIHNELIMQILKMYSYISEFNNELCLWKTIKDSDKKKVKEEVVIATLGWITKHDTNS